MWRLICLFGVMICNWAILMTYLTCLPSYNCKFSIWLFEFVFIGLRGIFGLSPCFLFCLRWIKISTVEVSNWHFGLGAGRNQRLSGFLRSWSHIQRLGVRFQLLSCLVSIARLGCLWKTVSPALLIIQNLVYCEIR